MRLLKSSVPQQRNIFCIIDCSVADPGSGAFSPPGSGIRIRDGAMVGSGSGMKHPGSATLIDWQNCTSAILLQLRDEWAGSDEAGG
jgi:hypothetical protein